MSTGTHVPPRNPHASLRPYPSLIVFTEALFDRKAEACHVSMYSAVRQGIALRSKMGFRKGVGVQDIEQEIGYIIPVSAIAIELDDDERCPIWVNGGS